MSKVEISRVDAVALCVALGFKTAKSWNKDRMTKKLLEVGGMVSDSGLEVDDDVDNVEYLNEVLKSLADAEEIEVTTPSEKPTKSKKTTKPKKETPPEPEEDEEEDEEEVVSVAKDKGKGKKTGGAKTITCYSASMEILCKNPDMPFADLQKRLEKKGLFKKTSARTAASNVKAVVAGLRKHGLMEPVK